MNSPALGLRVASVIFGLVGLDHVLRIVAHTTVLVGNFPIGRRWSAVAVVVLAVLSIWLWRLACTACQSKNAAPPVAPAA